MSPFSGNDSTLRNQVLRDDSLMSDATTMWEMDTLKRLKESEAWNKLPPLSRPQIIGPDRATALHTRNVLESFSGSVSFIRPDYMSLVDIVGTQSRYVDSSASRDNYGAISSSGLTKSWCTMCSQEWNRHVGLPLGSYSEGLRASRVSTGWWSRYDVVRGSAQPPASQALEGGLSGFVAEAAIPRFVSRLG